MLGEKRPLYESLFIVDIYQFFKGKGLGTFTNATKITALSDYKLPQVLRHLGVLVYCDELADVVDHKRELIRYSAPEVEIRAATIWSVELLKRSLLSRFPAITATNINDHFWLLGQNAAEMKPYHRCRTTDY